jgi:hypothetical protein
LISSSLAYATPTTNVAIAPRQAADSTLRIVVSSGIRVLGFRRNGPFFHYWSLFLSRSEIGNLPKSEAHLLNSETQLIFLISVRGATGSSGMLRSIIPWACSHDFPARLAVEVSLDAAETKMEDC